MSTLYKKTALNKMKKDELIKMFLDQQEMLNDYKLCHESTCTEALKTLSTLSREMTKNKELKEENKDLQTQVDHLVNKKINEGKYARQNNKLQTEIEKLKLENKKLYDFISYYDLPKPEHN